MKTPLQRALMACTIGLFTIFYVALVSKGVSEAVPTGVEPSASKGLQAAAIPANASPPNGVGAYPGGNNLNTSFQLPVLRSDTSGSRYTFDSIVHISNSTASSTNLTITFFNTDGSVNSTRNVPVPTTIRTWETVDLDVAQILGAGFQGSAILSTSPNAVAVSVDVIDGSSSASDDSIDAYPGIVGGSTSQYFPLAINYGSYATRFWIRNTSSSATANVTLKAYSNGTLQETKTNSFGPNGMGTLGVSAFNFVGPVEIDSDQPVAIITDVYGGAFVSTGAMSPAQTGSSVFIPRFEMRGNPAPGWSSNLAVLNTTPTSCTSNCNASFTATFFDQNGNIAGMISTPDGGVAPMRDWLVGNLPFSANQPVPVSDGFTGSVLVTQTAGIFPIVPLVFTFQGTVSTPNSINLAYNYLPAVSEPTGAWAYLPSIRKSSNGFTTAFTIMNPQTATQNYSITYWDHNGALLYETSLSLAPHLQWYVSQAADNSLPAGFNGSVQITNTTGGVPPAAIVNLYAGDVTAPAPQTGPAPTPICGSAATPVPATPSASGTPAAKVFLPAIFANYKSGC
jgi:hypothetical protein